MCQFNRLAEVRFAILVSQSPTLIFDKVTCTSVLPPKLVSQMPCSTHRFAEVVDFKPFRRVRFVISRPELGPLGLTPMATPLLLPRLLSVKLSKIAFPFLSPPDDQ